jgi:hypothetical protein
MMHLTVPKTVAITNPRVNAMYGVLKMAMMVFSIWNFFIQKQFDTNIMAETRASVSIDYQSVARAIRENRTANRPCPPDKANGIAALPDDLAVGDLQPRRQVSSICLPMCSGGLNDEDRSNCVSPMTFAHQRSSEEVAMWSARHVLSRDGTDVESFLGLPALGSVFFQIPVRLQASAGCANIVAMALSRAG